MNKDAYRILNNIVDLLEDKLKNDFENCFIAERTVHWSEYEKFPLSPEEIKERLADNDDTKFEEKLKYKVEITYHRVPKKDCYSPVKSEAIQITLDTMKEEETIVIPIRLLNRCRSPVRRALAMIKFANKLDFDRDVAKIDSLHAKIQPNRIDMILLGEDDGDKEN